MILAQHNQQWCPGIPESVLITNKSLFKISSSSLGTNGAKAVWGTGAMPEVIKWAMTIALSLLILSAWEFFSITRKTKGIFSPEWYYQLTWTVWGLGLDFCFLFGSVAGRLLRSKRQVDVLVIIYITGLHQRQLLSLATFLMCLFWRKEERKKGSFAVLYVFIYVVKCILFLHTNT